jgi:hypothetical protein
LTVGAGRAQRNSRISEISARLAPSGSQKFDLDTASNSYRHYLVWITKLPESAKRAEISEILLFR